MLLIEMKPESDIASAYLYSGFKFLPEKECKRLVRAFAIAVFLWIVLGGGKNEKIQPKKNHA